METEAAIGSFNQKGGVIDMHGWSSECGCGCQRGFLTKEEKVEMLKEYKQWLEKESQGVAERIKELQKEK
jgi:hypothetical protein